MREAPPIAGNSSSLMRSFMGWPTVWGEEAVRCADQFL